MRLSNKLAKIIFATVAVLLLSLSYILYQQIQSLMLTQERVDESNMVKLKLQETLLSLKDAETAQRGFLLTKDSLFLQPYEGAHQRASSLISDIRRHTAATAEQQRDINALETMVNLRFNTFNLVIGYYDDPSINSDTRKGHLLHGKSAMDSIRTTIDRIERREDQLVAEGSRMRDRYNFLTPFYAILLMLLAIGILVFSYAKITEQLNRLKKLLVRMRKMNRQLKRKNHQLEMSNKELDSFTYIASHDLKEPLRKIQTYVDLIESGPTVLEGRDESYFKRVKHSAQRMQNLLDDLLLYTHVTMSEKKFEAVDLNKVVEDVKLNLVEELTENEAKIQTSILPVVKGLPFQIRQLFENLISNSLKYKQASRAPQILIESSLVDRHELPESFPKKSTLYHRVHFSDNGSGFEQTYAEKIFRLFQRLHQDEGKPGTGIGLTICKKIVDNHHGYIKAISEVNKGTIFEIYFPAQ